MRRMKIQREEAERLLGYDPDTGIFTWKPRMVRCRGGEFRDLGYGGKIAGCKQMNPNRTPKRVSIILNRVTYPAHYLALVMSGIDVPDGMVIDHINRNPWDNRLCNLRVLSHVQNIQNSDRKRGASGYRGVCITPSGKYEARIVITKGRGRVMSKTGFLDPRDAAMQHDKWAIAHRGGLAMLNFPRSMYMFLVDGNIRQ
ncbi:MAG TPA: HNH endonuclease [Flavobacteriales bacterium]|nr:HNH endonuclease [Flavobacteriales bacterium]